MKQDVLLVGTGALATLFAVQLGAAGHSVHMLGTWKEGLQALRTNGARLVDSSDQEITCKVHATDQPAEVRGIRYAIVLVKSWQTERAALQLKECLPQDGLALTLQNGLGNLETLTNMLGVRRVALGTITAGATLLE